MRTRIRDSRRLIKDQVGFAVEIEFVDEGLSDIGIDSYQIIQAERSNEDPQDDFFLWHLGNHQQDFATPEEAASAFVEAWFKLRPPLSVKGVH